MHPLEGFQFANNMNLNMGYYTVESPPQIKYTTTIVTKLGRLCHNRDLMIVFTSAGG